VSVPRSIRAALPLAAAIALAFPATAQQERAADKEATRSLERVKERNRETMHAGDPFELVGLEDDSTDFRSATPALVNGDRDATRVDPDEAHRRALAMYDRGAVFHQPLAAAADDEAAPAPERERRTSAPVHAEVGLPRELSWSLSIAFALLLAVGARRRLRLALRARRQAS